MNKKDLINAVVEKTQLNRTDCTMAVVATINAITEALVAGEKVQLPGFGSFEVKERPARTYMDIHSKERVTTEPTKALSFRPSKTVKDALNK